MTSQDRELDAREQRFVDEYLIDLDPERAALEAGYASSTAKTKAYCWASNSKRNDKPYLFEAIQKAKQERSERTGIDQDWVLKRLALLADANLKKIASWDVAGVTFKDSEEMSDDEAYTLSEIILKETIKETEDGKELIMQREKRLKPITPGEKKACLELIGKHVGMFAEKKEPEKPTGTEHIPLTYTQFHSLSEDEKTIYLATGVLPVNEEKPNA